MGCDITKLIVAVTGTPGTGKSTFAMKTAARLGDCDIVEMNAIVERHRLYSGRDAFGSKTVRMHALQSALKKEIAKSDRRTILVVGHLSPGIDFGQRITVVLRASLRTIEKRLMARRYPKGKIAENLVSEAVDYCGANSAGEVYEVEKDAEKREIIRYILKLSKGIRAREPRKRKIDKLGELLTFIKGGNRYGF